MAHRFVRLRAHGRCGVSRPAPSPRLGIAGRYSCPLRKCEIVRNPVVTAHRNFAK